MSEQDAKKAPPAYYITVDPVTAAAEGARQKYFVSIDVSTMLDTSEDLRSMIVWLNGLKPNVTLELSLHCGSNAAVRPFGAYLAMLNAITTCKAKTIGIVDHFFGGMDAYFLLVCENLIVSPFGQIVLNGSAANDKSISPDVAVVLNEFCQYLVRNATQAGLLTEEECSTVLGGATVYLSPADLDARVKS